MALVDDGVRQLREENAFESTGNLCLIVKWRPVKDVNRINLLSGNLFFGLAYLAKSD